MAERASGGVPRFLGQDRERPTLIVRLPENSGSRSTPPSPKSTGSPVSLAGNFDLPSETAR